MKASSGRGQARFGDTFNVDHRVSGIAIFKIGTISGLTPITLATGGCWANSPRHSMTALSRSFVNDARKVACANAAGDVASAAALANVDGTI